MTLSTIIVGLGQIGMGYDIDADVEDYILTHARAFSIHSEFDLVAGVDPDESKRAKFAEAYGGAVYANVANAVTTHQPDIVVVACPSEYHFSVIETVLQQASPPAIICEKPLCHNVVEAEQVIKLCADNDTQLYVNYMRRSDPGTLEISRRLRSDEIIKPVRGVVWYSKGLFNTASHLLNLLQEWFGVPNEYHVQSKGRLWDGKDPEPDFTVGYDGGRVTFIAAKEENFSHYTIELVAENGRLRYEQAGSHIVWQPAIRDPVCDGYTVLDNNEQIISSELNKAQWHVAEQLSIAMRGESAQICSGEEALRTLIFISAIQREL